MPVDAGCTKTEMLPGSEFDGISQSNRRACEIKELIEKEDRPVDCGGKMSLSPFFASLSSSPFFRILINDKVKI
jgi:hypothetical protein